MSCRKASLSPLSARRGRDARRKRCRAELKGERCVGWCSCKRKAAAILAKRCPSACNDRMPMGGRPEIINIDMT